MRCRATAAALAVLAVARWWGVAARDGLEPALPREANDDPDGVDKQAEAAGAHAADADATPMGEASTEHVEAEVSVERAAGEADASAEHVAEGAAAHAEVEGQEHGGEHGEGAGAEEHAEGHGEARGEVHGDVNGGGHEKGHGGHTEAETLEQLAVGKALAYTLLGSVAWIMLFFYQLNSSDKDIVSATWRILYDMISIFVAVLLFQSLKVVTVEFFGEAEGHGTEPPDLWTIAIATARLVVIYTACSLLLFSLRFKEVDRLWTLKVVAGIGGHAVGFAAIDVFGNFLELGTVRVNLWFAILLVTITFVFLSIVFEVHEVSLQAGGCDEEFLEVRAEFEDDAACLCMGLQLSMIVREVITGEMPPLHGYAKGHSGRECFMLFAVAVALGFGVVGISNSLGNMRRHRHFNRFVERIMEMLKMTTSLTMGWCLLYWGQWYFWYFTEDKGIGEGTTMTARLLQSLASTAVCFLGIRVVDFFADHANHHTRRGLRQLLRVFGLLMGLTWEACFGRAVEDIAAGTQGLKHTCLVSGIALLLSAVVVPAWALYILPHIIEDEELEHKEDELESSSSCNDEATT